MIGSIAGVISALAFLPQALKVWRHQSTKSISRAMYVLYSLSIVLWGVYAWMINSWPLFLTEIVTGVMAGYILVMTLRGSEE